MPTYQYPFKTYKLGSLYGVKGKTWSCGYHSGLDLFNKATGGDGKVYPAAEGKVIRATPDNGGSYGNFVTVEHPDGYLSLYAHLEAIKVTLGAKVSLDTVLGIEGSTGNSSAPHLHLEIHKGAYAYPSKIDPKKFLDEKIKENDDMPLTQSEFNKMFAESMSAWLAERNAKTVPQSAGMIGPDGTYRPSFSEEFDAAKAAGITDGTRPQAYATRAEVAVMCLRVSKK